MQSLAAKNTFYPDSSDYVSLLDSLCRLVYTGKYKEAEKTLLVFLETVINHSNGINTLERKKTIISKIYFDFNKRYTDWLKTNKLNVDRARKKIDSNGHSNYFISHSTNIAEMDDLLFGLVEFNNSDDQKKEMKYNLGCYKKQINI